MTKPSEAPSARDKGCARLQRKEYGSTVHTCFMGNKLWQDTLSYDMCASWYIPWTTFNRTMFKASFPQCQHPIHGLTQMTCCFSCTCTLAKPPPKAVVIPERPCHHCNLVAWQPAGSGDKVETQNGSESMSQLPMEAVHNKAQSFKAHTTLSRGDSTHEWLPSAAPPKKPFPKVCWFWIKTCWCWNHVWKKELSKQFAGKQPMWWIRIIWRLKSSHFKCA